MATSGKCREYDAAKERQGFIEGRIQEVEATAAEFRSSIPSCLMPMAAAFWRHSRVGDQTVTA